MSALLTQELAFSSFENPNGTIWPLQLVAYPSAIASLYFTVMNSQHSRRVPSVIFPSPCRWIGPNDRKRAAPAPTGGK
jgi:hypothetical protein